MSLMRSLRSRAAKRRIRQLQSHQTLAIQSDIINPVNPIRSYLPILSQPTSSKAADKTRTAPIRSYLSHQTLAILSNPIRSHLPHQILSTPSSPIRSHQLHQILSAPSNLIRSYLILSISSDSRDAGVSDLRNSF